MDVLQLDPAIRTHVKQFSEIRLRALRTDPAAFGSTYQRELAFGDADWRGRLEGFAGHPGAVFAAVASPTVAEKVDMDTDPVGIIGVGLAEPTDATIWGMWVAPEGRRRRVAARLLDRAEAWAVESGADTATLWVHRSNDGAQALYRSRGFELVGPDDLPVDVPGACADEVCMRVRLASS